MNNKGIVLLLSLIVIVVLGVLGGIISSRAISESKVVQRHIESAQAFWLAEAAVNKALKQLRTDFSNAATINVSPFGSGKYSATIGSSNVEADGISRIVTAHGFVPATSSRVERVIEVTMKKFNFPEFYDDVLYAAGDVRINGSSYSITGGVTYATTISDTANIGPAAPVHDPTIRPLAALDFAALRTMSQSQGNYHNASNLGGPFPTSFWYNEALSIPNIVFLEGDLDLKGTGLVGGFFVVGGEATYNASMSGDIAFAGCIYTRGNLTMNGGGHVLNIDGAAWVGGNTTMNGGVTLTANSAYTTAIQNLNLLTLVQVISWTDLQNPYTLSH